MTAFTTLNILETSPRDTVARNAIEEIRTTLASQSQAGLMSDEDKAKLDGIEAGATHVEISVTSDKLVVTQGEEDGE